MARADGRVRGEKEIGLDAAKRVDSQDGNLVFRADIGAAIENETACQNKESQLQPRSYGAKARFGRRFDESLLVELDLVASRMRRRLQSRAGQSIRAAPPSAASRTPLRRAVTMAFRWLRPSTAPCAAGCGRVSYSGEVLGSMRWPAVGTCRGTGGARDGAARSAHARARRRPRFALLVVAVAYAIRRRRIKSAGPTRHRTGLWPPNANWMRPSLQRPI